MHVAGGDLPTGHDAYDYNVNILPDPAFRYLLAGDPVKKTGNYAGDGEDTNRVHTEWEDLSVLKYAWAEPGDTLTEKGSWVWDCGHWGTSSEIFPPGPDYVIPNVGQRCLIPQLDPQQCSGMSGEAAEFHPYRAIWDVRKQSATSPFAENQAELFVSTDKTVAGKEADCAHYNPPTAFSASAAIIDPTTYYLTYPAGYGSCVLNEPNWQDVSEHYSFLLSAPAAPVAGARLVFRAVDRGSVGSPPAPVLTQEGNGVRVTFDIGIDATAKPRMVMAYTVYAGWDTVPSAALPTHLHVNFDKLEIHRSMDAPDCRTANFFCASESTRQNQQSNCVTPPCTGQWNLYWDVNGVWGQWGRSDTDSPLKGELDVKDGDVLPGTQAVDLYVPPGRGWRLFTVGRECDLGLVGPLGLHVGDLADCSSNHDLADDNDVPGLILDQYSSAQGSLGTHRSNGRTHKDDPTSSCPDPPANPDGCYSITYTVTQVNDVAQRARLRGGGNSPNTSPGGWVRLLLPVALVALLILAGLRWRARG